MSRDDYSWDHQGEQSDPHLHWSRRRQHPRTVNTDQTVSFSHTFQRCVCGEEHSGWLPHRPRPTTALYHPWRPTDWPGSGKRSRASTARPWPQSGREEETRLDIGHLDRGVDTTHKTVMQTIYLCLCVNEMIPDHSKKVSLSGQNKKINYNENYNDNDNRNGNYNDKDNDNYNDKDNRMTPTMTTTTTTTHPPFPS